jgi:hypothetical protein
VAGGLEELLDDLPECGVNAWIAQGSLRGEGVLDVWDNKFTLVDARTDCHEHLA